MHDPSLLYLTTLRTEVVVEAVDRSGELMKDVIGLWGRERDGEWTQGPNPETSLEQHFPSLSQMHDPSLLYLATLRTEVVVEAMDRSGELMKDVIGLWKRERDGERTQGLHHRRLVCG